MKELVYVADPMCSWCWGFAPVINGVEEQFDVPIRWVMGGLAPDSDEPMAPQMRQFVQSAWRTVEAATGVPFNHDFWTRCQPRRSTYPACRAVVAAAAQRGEAGPAMFRRIQRAYYLEARNPSDQATLEDLAADLDPALDGDQFRRDLTSPAIDAELCNQLAEAGRLGVRGFPTLLAMGDSTVEPITRGWCSLDECIRTIERIVDDTKRPDS